MHTTTSFSSTARSDSVSDSPRIWTFRDPLFHPDSNDTGGIVLPSICDLNEGDPADPKVYQAASSAKAHTSSRVFLLLRFYLHYLHQRDNFFNRFSRTGV